MNPWQQYIKQLHWLAQRIPAGLCQLWLLITGGGLLWQLGQGQSGVHLLPFALAILWGLLLLLMQQLFATLLPMKPAKGFFSIILWYLRLIGRHILAFGFVILTLSCLFWSLKLLSVILRNF